MSDLEEAKEALDTLSRVLPVLPAELEAALGQARALESRIEGLQQQVEERRAQAAELLDELRGALDGVGDEAEAREGALRDAAEEIDSGLQSLQGLEQSHAALAAAVEAAGEAMDALQGRLAEGASQIAAQRAASDGALDNLKSALDDGEQALENAVDAVADEAGALAQEADEAQDAVDQAADMLREQMLTYAERGEQRMQAARQMAHELEAEQTSAIDGHLGTLDQSQAELRQRLEQEVGTAIQQDLATAVGESAAAATALSEAIGGVLGGLVEHREAAQPLVEGCCQTVGPVQDMIANVREAAEQAGLDW